MNWLERFVPAFLKRSIRYVVQYLSGYSPEIQEQRRRLIAYEESTRLLCSHLQQVYETFSQAEEGFLSLDKRLLQLEARAGILKTQGVEVVQFKKFRYFQVSPEGCLIDANSLQFVIKKDLERYAGGIYNAGGIRRGDRIFLLARAEPYAEIERAQEKVKMMTGAIPFLAECNDEMIPVSTCELEPVGFSSERAFRIEDFRIFEYQGETYAHHSYVFFPPLFQILKNRTCFCRQALSRINFEKKALEFVGFPKLDRKLCGIEKNWVYLNRNSDLYLFYSFYPDFVVKKMTSWDGLNFKTIIDKRVAIPGLEAFRYISYSTSPIPFDDQHYLLVVHARRSESVLDYLHWGVLISRQTLFPVKMTRCPIIRGGSARGIYKHVVFVTSVLCKGKDFVFIMGEGDFYTSTVTVSRDLLDANWVPIASSAASGI